MRKIKVVFSFTHLAVSLLVEFARNMVVKMTGNPNFTEPDVPLDTITTAATTLETKFNAAQGGGKQQTADMHQARIALEDLLHKEASYVDRIANGNEPIILSSGYNTSKQPLPAKRPSFTVTNGNHEGEILLKHKAEKNAKSWAWQYCTDPITATGWIQAGISTQATFTVTGLMPGTKYWFRAAHVKPSGMSEWCEPIAKYAV